MINFSTRGGMDCAFVILLLLTTAACGSDPTHPADPTDPVDPPDSAPVASEVVLFPPADPLIFGESAQLEVAVFDQDGEVMPDAAVQWTSSDGAVAGIDESGLVTAVHVGSVTITARSGQATANAELVVDPQSIQLTLLDDGVPAFQVARLAVPGDRISEDSTMPGNIGGRDVAFAAVAPDTVAFVAPDLQAGTHEGSVALDANHVGIFSLAIAASGPVSDPDAVVLPVLDGMSDVLDAWAARAPDDPNLADAQALVDDFMEGYAAATPEERLETARLMESNPEAFTIFDPSALDASAELLFMSTASSVRAAFRANVQAFIGTQVGLGLTVGVFSVTAWACAVSGGSALPSCLAAVGSAAVLLANLGTAAEAGARLLDTVFVPVDGLSVALAGGGSQVGLSAGPGDHAASLQPVSLVPLEHGVPRALDVRSSFRTITPDDASRSDLLLEFSGSLTLFNEIWSTTASALQRIHGFFSASPTLHGNAPGYRAQPRSEVLSVESGDVSLGSVSSDAVECAGAPSGGVFALTCTTEEFTNQHFDFELVYASEFGATSSSFSGVLEPEDVESTITISNLTFAHDPNPEPHLCCLFVYLDMDVEVTGMVIDPEEANPGSFSLSYSFSPQFDWSVINTYGTSPWWNGDRLRWGMSIHRAREVEDEEIERSSSVTLYITYFYNGVTSNTLVRSIGL